MWSNIRHRLPVLALAALVACSAEPEPTPKPKPVPPPPGQILGSLVVESALGEPAPAVNARVTLFPTGRAARTDAQGSFAFDGLAAGTYVLRCELDVDEDGVVDVGVNREVVLVASGGEVSGADLDGLVLARLGSVEGLVSSGEGGAPGVLVALSANGPGAGGERLSATDAEGRFVFDRVLPGDWTVEALAPATPPSGAHAAVVVGGGGIARVTLALAPLEPQATLFGTIRTPPGATEPVDVIVTDGNGEVARVETPPDTLFELNVPTGVYTAVVRSRNPALAPLVVANLPIVGRTELRPGGALVNGDGRDLDGDGVPAPTDADDDGDGCVDAQEPESTRFDALSCADVDGDGLGDGIDLDDDGDGMTDLLDACPLRFDPPGLDVRPAGCAAYAAIGLVASAPAQARVGVAFDVFANVVDPLGGVDTELAATGPEGAEPADLEAAGEGRWRVTLAAPGTWTLRVRSSDAFRAETSELVVVVDAPPIVIEAASFVRGAVDAPVELVAVTPEPLTAPTWSWEVVGGGTTVPSLEPLAPGRALFQSSAPGSFVVRATARQGARSGAHDMTIEVVAPPLDLVVPEPEVGVVTTAGVPAPVEVALAVPEAGVTWEWSLPDGVTLVESDGARAVVVAAEPGRYTLTVEASRGARTGAAVVTLDVRPVGAVALSVVAPALEPGEEATFSLATVPALEGATYTYVSDSANPPGARLDADGASITFSAPGSGTYTFAVEAVAGRLIARGSFTLVVGRPPLAVAVVQTPRPIVVRGAPVSLVASSVDAVAGSWAWSARSTNPSQPALTGADTDHLSFSPDATGLYVFDVAVAAGDRSGQVAWTVEVVEAPEIPIGVYWVEGYVGGMLNLRASVGETLTGLTWRWAEDPGNPEPLGITGQTFATAVAAAAPTVAGLYRFTVQATAGGRTGTKSFAVEVLPEDLSRLPLSLGVSPVEGTAGFPLTVTAYVSGVSAGLTEVRWTPDASNPAPVATTVPSRQLTFTPPVPGRYRFRADAYLGDRHGEAVVDVVVHPPVPLVLSVTPEQPMAYVAAQLLATTPDTSAPVTYSWTVTKRPEGSSSGSFQPSRTSANPTFAPRGLGEWTLTVDARIGVRRGTQTLTFVAVERPPAPTGMPVPAPLVPHYDTNPDGLRVAVGRPVTLPALCPECTDATWTWTQASGPAAALSAEGPRMTFVPPAAGAYTFTVRAAGASYSMSRGVTVTAYAETADVYIDGDPGLLVSPSVNQGVGAWYCGSPRADVESVTWTHASGGIDGDVVADGPWLYFRPRSFARRMTTWTCTVRTTGGETFSRTRPAVVVPAKPHRVFFFGPDAPVDGPGTFDAPTSNMNILVWSCFMGICWGDPTGNVVLFAGTYTTSLTGQGMADSVVGGVDPVTFEQDPVAHPSIIEWRDTKHGGLWPHPIVRATHLDGVDLRFGLKAGAAMPPYLIGLGNGARIVRSSIRVVGTGEAVSLFGAFYDRANPPQLVGNRFMFRGVGGAAMLEDNCRGMLVAHNVFDLDAASTGSAVKADCSAVATQVPSQLVNNVIYQRNGAPAFDLWGSPATDSGSAIGGNWFSGTGPFAVAAFNAGGALSVDVTTANAGRLHGGLDGGGNTSDPACFPADPGDDSWGVRIAAGSACATGGVRPNQVYAPDLSIFGFDVDGDPVNVAAWTSGTGTISIGADQPAP